MSEQLYKDLGFTDCAELAKQADQIAELQAENERVKTALQDPATVWVSILRGTIARPQALDHYEEMKAKFEAMQSCEVDAKRYRWLRDEAGEAIGAKVCCETGFERNEVSGTDLDALIDSAMKPSGGTEWLDIPAFLRPDPKCMTCGRLFSEHSNAGSVCPDGDDCSRAPLPEKQCQHDFLAPNPTVTATSDFDASCSACKQEWHLPRPKLGGSDNG